MQTIKYPISLQYVKDWGEYEIVREVISNAKDAGDFHINVANDELYVKNTGVIPLECFLLGESQKIDKQTAIGKFGEGMKIALLVALREGIEVRIRTADYVAIPKIGSAFGREILVIEFDDAPYYANYTAVRIIKNGIGQRFENEYKPNFLFLTHPNLPTHFPFLSEEFSGVYVKGVKLPEAPNSLFGYNLDIELTDRDRRGASNYREACISLLSNSINYESLSEEGFESMLFLDEDSLLESNFSYLHIYNLPEKYRRVVRKVFGEKSVMSSDTISNNRAVWNGYNVLEGLSPLQNFFCTRTFKTASAVIEEIEYENPIPDNALTNEQSFFLNFARRVARRVGYKGSIQAFGGENPLHEGFYRYHSEEMFIHTSCLTSYERTLDVLIHELAHWYSGSEDLTRSHTLALSYIGAKVACIMEEV